jgi:murein DD-endopeptidase MepM/ murein hydrolase activator NlpD
MVRDDRLYAFIVARTSRSRSQIRRICVHKRWLKLSAFLVFLVLGAALYGLYGLTQHAMHLRVERENDRLRFENERQRQQLNDLNRRVQAVEDTSRRLVEMSGVAASAQQTELPRGAGGPSLPMDSLTAIEYRTNHIERTLRTYEAILRERATVPSLWPVKGDLESGFGGRRNPFGGPGYEFHTGQDIDADIGTPVQATANGTVSFAGWQNGYGQLVVVDHGDGLTTRYGHLSQIDATVGQAITRGTVIGLTGSTGRSTGPHLHYEVRINDKPVDPRPYLPGAEGQ